MLRELGAPIGLAAQDTAFDVVEFEGPVASAQDAFADLFASFITADAPGLGFAVDQPATASNATETPSLVVTTADDIVADDGLTSLREAIDFAEANAVEGSGGTTVTFAASVFSDENTDIVFADGA
ncbi:MAG: hypothetical protein ACFB2Z_09010, partial [Maricaulaceae bacterium]